jgi:hypothetical protein
VEAKLNADRDAGILAEAAHRRRMEGLGKFPGEWQAEHGAFTDEEMTEALQDITVEPITRQDGMRPGNSSAGPGCGTRSTTAWRCSRDLVTGCLRVILPTWRHCAGRQGTTLW